MADITNDVNRQKINFVFEKDLSQFSDSMLFPQNTEVAQMTVEDDEIVELRLLVRGCARVQYKGCEYGKVEDFPNELINLIKNDPKWTVHDDVLVSENNWFEYIYELEKNGKTYSDGIMFESVPGKYSPIMLFYEMFNICRKIKEKYA